MSLETGPLEQAGAHEQGDCAIDCPHPECTWAGLVDLSLFDLVAFDDVEAACREQSEPVLL